MSRKDLLNKIQKINFMCTKDKLTNYKRKNFKNYKRRFEDDYER